MSHTIPGTTSTYLGHLDLKLVEGKRSGSWRTRTTWVWPANGFLYKCIGCIGLWTVSHLWYSDSNIFLFSSLEGMRQRTPRNQCMFFLDVLKLLLFATCPSPRPLRPGEKSQLNLTFHLEWCYTNRIRNVLFQRTACPLFARILIDLLYLFLAFRVGKAVEISWLTMQSIAHWMLELLEPTTKLCLLQ